MKRGFILATAAVAALSLAACNRQEAANNPANPGQSEPVNAAQDAIGAAVGQTSAATLGANTKQGYVMNAAVGDMYEIAAGQMAQQRSKNNEVKSFAKMLVTDHTAASNQMKPLAQTAGETPPAEMDQRRKGMIDNLKAASDADFDKVFLAQQVTAHEESLTLHRGYADNGDEAGLKGHAAKVAPKIQAHLDQARKLQGAAGQAGAAGGATPEKK
jgi:putative membrane protein